MRKTFSRLPLWQKMPLFLCALLSVLSVSLVLSAARDASAECLIVFPEQPTRLDSVPVLVVDPVSGSRAESTLSRNLFYKFSTSPDGRYVVYVKNSSLSREAYVEDTATGKRQPLYGDKGPNRLLWSPDGRQMAYLTAISKGKPSAFADQFVVISDANGDKPSAFQFADYSASVDLLGWSPLGKYVVVGNFNTQSVFIVRAADMVVAQSATGGPVDAGHFFWFTDRYFIQFEGQTATIHNMSTGATLTLPDIGAQGKLDFSPVGNYAVTGDQHEMYRLEDGAKTPYGGTQGFWDSASRFITTIPRADHNGYDLRAYHPDTDSYDPPLAPNIAQNFEVAPDHQHILYGRLTGSTKSAYLFDIKSRRETLIGSGFLQNAKFMDWWFDNSHILVLLGVGANPGPYIIDATTGRVLSQLDKINSGWLVPLSSPDSGDIWLLWRDVSGQSWVSRYGEDGLLKVNYPGDPATFSGNDEPSPYPLPDRSSILLTSVGAGGWYNLIQLYSDQRPARLLIEGGLNPHIEWSSNKEWLAFDYHSSALSKSGVAIFDKQGNLVTRIEPVSGSLPFWSSCAPPFDRP